jgi:hypothetical protein
MWPNVVINREDRTPLSLFRSSVWLRMYTSCLCLLFTFEQDPLMRRIEGSHIIPPGVMLNHNRKDFLSLSTFKIGVKSFLCFWDLSCFVCVCDPLVKQCYSIVSTAAGCLEVPETCLYFPFSSSGLFVETFFLDLRIQSPFFYPWIIFSSDYASRAVKKCFGPDTWNNFFNAEYFTIL